MSKPCAETQNRLATVCVRRKSNFQACLPASASNIPAPLFLEWRTALQHRGKAKHGGTGEAEEVEWGAWCGKKEEEEVGGVGGSEQPIKTVGGSERQSRRWWKEWRDTAVVWVLRAATIWLWQAYVTRLAWHLAHSRRRLHWVLYNCISRSSESSMRTERPTDTQTHNARTHAQTNKNQ